eukprot:GILK01009050.1.p1 GENE.GILK01009050.1~~GILK01009050.1.p1  ORF type:complete len:322 (-),score=24.17 GILK01009050.1:27-992(-)
MSELQERDCSTDKNRTAVGLVWRPMKRARRAEANIRLSVFSDDGDDGDQGFTHAPSSAGSLLILEDANIMSLRLKQEGLFLAENGRYSEALKRWNESLEAAPSAVVHELKAQVWLELEDYFMGIESASAAVQLAPDWADAHVTLGRAQRNYGELELAARSFQTACSLNPQDAAIASELKEVEDLLMRQRELTRLREVERLTSSSSTSRFSFSRDMFPISSESCFSLLPAHSLSSICMFCDVVDFTNLSFMSRSLYAFSTLSPVANLIWKLYCERLWAISLDDKVLEAFHQTTWKALYIQCALAKRYSRHSKVVRAKVRYGT